MGGQYLSGSEPLVVFATGDCQENMKVEVIWRSGRQSTIREVRSNHIYEIDESLAEIIEKSVNTSMITLPQNYIKT